jgi:hypothetical protein
MFTMFRSKEVNNTSDKIITGVLAGIVDVASRVVQPLSYVVSYFVL